MENETTTGGNIKDGTINVSPDVAPKHAGGRPTDYRGLETLLKANKYIDSCQDEQYQLTKLDGNNSTSYENKLKVKLPTIEGLAVYLEVRRSTIYDWKEKYEEFSDIIERLQSIQAEKLLNNGLSGDYNSTIAKVLLTKHGYIEKQETEHSGGIIVKQTNYGDRNFNSAQIHSKELSTTDSKSDTKSTV
jgi:hypothetical protein